MVPGVGRGRGVPCSVTALVTGSCRATGCRSTADGKLCQLAIGVHGDPFRHCHRRETPLSNRTHNRAAQGRAVHRTRGTRLMSSVLRPQNRTHESGPSRPVDRPPLGGPVMCPVRKGGFTPVAMTKWISVHADGELAKLAVCRGTAAGRAARPGHKCGHRARHPPTAPHAGNHRGPEPSPGPLDDGPMRVRCTTVLTIEPVWQDLERGLTFLLVLPLHNLEEVGN